MNLWQKFVNTLIVSETKGAGTSSMGGAALARPQSVSGVQWGHLSWSNTAGGSDRDWKSEAGRLQDNSAVSILLGCVANNFADAPLCVRRFNKETGAYEVVADHPLAVRMKRPNPFWTRTQLFRAIITSLYLDGNAYILKARDEFGKVVELWWLPHQAISVLTDEAGQVVSYRYQTRGNVTFYDPGDIVHLKIGVNTERPELGESPLRAVLREVCTDNEIQNYTFSILKNMGVPGVILTPQKIKGEDGETFPEVSPTLSDKVKQLWRRLTTGDARGEPLVMNTPWDVHTPGFKPSEMLLDKHSELSEVRIAGAFGVPVVVVQFLAGLRNVNAKASYAASIQQLYGCCIIPLQRLVCEWFDLQLLAEFGDIDNEHCWFDRAEVGALQEDTNAIWMRALNGFKVGLLTRGDGRSMVGLSTDADDDAYIFEIQGGAGGEDPQAETQAGEGEPEGADPTDSEAQKAASLSIAERWRRAGFAAPEVELLR